MTDIAPYIAQGKSLKAVEAFERGVLAFREKALELGHRLGATGVRMSTANDIYGFEFDEPPDGWREMRQGGYIPKRTSKANRQLYAEIKAVHYRSLDLYLGAPFIMVRGQFRLRCGLQKAGDKWLITVPLNDKDEPFFEPEDAVRLKMSEYYRLLEGAL